MWFLVQVRRMWFLVQEKCVLHQRKKGNRENTWINTNLEVLKGVSWLEMSNTVLRHMKTSSSILLKSFSEGKPSQIRMLNFSFLKGAYVPCTSAETFSDSSQLLLLLFCPCAVCWWILEADPHLLCLHGSLTSFLSKMVYFGTPICPFSTKSLLHLHGFLLTRLFFQSLKNSVSRGIRYKIFWMIKLQFCQVNHNCKSISQNWRINTLSPKSIQTEQS